MKDRQAGGQADKIQVNYNFLKNSLQIETNFSLQQCYSITKQYECIQVGIFGISLF